MCVEKPNITKTDNVITLITFQLNKKGINAVKTKSATNPGNLCVEPLCLGIKNS